MVCALLFVDISEDFEMFETEIDCGLLGELEVQITYVFHPRQPARLYPVELSHPAEPAEIEVQSCIVSSHGPLKNVDVWSMLETDDQEALKFDIEEYEESRDE